ncbi:MAG: hypothetical protein MRERC_5c077 [Mycoplasmataceae bacterium RC_NB112A]|nr:MAG: hypothetical protein MRERC_5c077 [Mycoplasmataceae bacterium RC_NB112A]
MPSKWCTNCQNYKEVTFESTIYCPGCKKYALVSSTICNTSFTNQVGSVSRALADTANEKNVEIECKIEQADTRTGEYRSVSKLIRPRK